MSTGLPSQPESGARVELRGSSFEAPSTWETESLLTFRAPGDLPRPTLSVSRVKAPRDATLESMMTERIAMLSRYFAVLEVEETRETMTLAGRALEVRFSFEELEGAFLQRMTFVQATDGIYVLVGRSMRHQSAELNAVFDHLAATFRPTLPGTTR